MIVKRLLSGLTVQLQLIRHSIRFHTIILQGSTRESGSLPKLGKFSKNAQNFSLRVIAHRKYKLLFYPKRIALKKLSIYCTGNSPQVMRAAVHTLNSAGFSRTLGVILRLPKKFCSRE